MAYNINEDDWKNKVNGLRQMPSNAPVTAQGGGLSFAGAAGDAAKFFADPPRAPRPQAAALQEAPTQAQSALSQPTMLGPESGLGWKTRLGMYRAQMENTTANQTNAAGLDRQRLANQGSMDLQQSKNENDLAMQQGRIDSAKAMQQAGFDNSNQQQQKARGWAMDDATRTRSEKLEDQSAARQFDIFKQTGDPEVAAAMGSGPWASPDYSKVPGFDTKQDYADYQNFEYTNEAGDTVKTVRDRRSGLELPESYYERMKKKLNLGGGASGF